MTARNCPACGAAVPDNATSCPNCGASVATETGGSRRRGAWIAGGAVAIVLIGAAVAYALLADRAEADILYQDATSQGPDPFIPVAAVPTATPAPGTGLFGGSGDNAVCNAEGIIAFLDRNPAKRRAWSAVSGVPEAEIAAYIRTLRPVILARDVRVTNHGYRDGRAYPFQAILQKGTAVFVEPDGDIVIRCRCGNWLKRPITTVGKCRGCPAYTPAPPCEREECFSPEPCICVVETPPPTLSPTPCVPGAANECPPTPTPRRTVVPFTPPPQTDFEDDATPVTKTPAPAPTPAPTAVPTAPRTLPPRP